MSLQSNIFLKVTIFLGISVFIVLYTKYSLHFTTTKTIRRVSGNLAYFNSSQTVRKVFIGKKNNTVSKHTSIIPQPSSVSQGKLSTNISNMLKNQGSSRDKKQNIVTKVCTITPLTSRGFKGRHISTTALKTIMLASLEKNNEKKYNYACFFGYDEGDKYWHKHKPHIMRHFDNQANIEVDVLMVKGGTYTKAVNELAQYAYTHGEHRCDYFVRVNDDGEFQSQKWASAAIKVLSSFNPPNVGAVGPVGKRTCCRILIFDMVHRTHLDIFDTYYPAVLDNWWTDDWITKVYGKNRQFVKGWKMEHHVSKHGQRYTVKMTQQKYLQGALESGKKKLQNYLSNF